MLKTNIDTLPMISVQGEVTHPLLSLSGKMGVNGENMYLTGTGGIVYNAKIGDSATAWTADHLEPGVSIRNNAGPEQNAALTVYSCIGHRASSCRATQRAEWASSLESTAAVRTSSVILTARCLSGST